MRFFILIIASLPLAAQIQTFTGINGLGHSTPIAIDRDGDAYGTGPQCVINTTFQSGVAAGTAVVITPVSMTGTITGNTNSNTTISGITDTRMLQVGETISGSGIPASTTITAINPPPNSGSIVYSITISNAASATATGVTLSIGIGLNTVLRIGTVNKMERATVTAVTSTTFTATLALAHSAGELISDQGVLGPDADDLDPLVHSTTDVTTKYGTIAAFLQKFANDLTAENPFANPNQSTSTTAAMTAAVTAGLTSPTHTWYIGNSSPTGGWSAGSDSNNCSSTSLPCLTFSRLVTEGWVAGDLVFFGPSANMSLITTGSGTSAKHSTFMAYPGATPPPIVRADNLAGAKFNLTDVHYVSVIGIGFWNASFLNGGTTDGVSPSDGNNIFVEYSDTSASYNATGNFGGFNGINNWVVEYNVVSNSWTALRHGMYFGSRQLPGSNTIIRRNVIYNNDGDGIHFNGRITGLIVDQNIMHDLQNNGLSWQEGVSSSFARGNLIYNTQQAAFQIYDYQGACGDATQGNAQYVCPYDQTGNLIGNNTLYNSLQGNYTVQVASDTTGCVFSALTCPSPTLQGNLGGNTFRNNIFVGGGNTGGTPTTFAHPPVIYNNCVSGTSSYFQSNADYPWTGPCLFNTGDTFLTTTTFDHNIWFEIGTFVDGTAVVGYGPVANDGTKYTSHGQTQGSGFFRLTCSGLTGVTTNTNCTVGSDPQFANASFALNSTSSPLQDYRLLASSPANQGGSTTGIPANDMAGRAYLSDHPSIGALERNRYAQGWTALTGATLLSAAPPDATGCPQLALGAACASIQIGGGKYQYQTSIRAVFRERTGAVGVTTSGNENLCLIAGGGHSDSGDNSTYCLNLSLATPAWSRPFGPSLVNATTQGLNSDCVPYPSPCNVPVSRHNTEEMAYMPWANKSVLWNGGVWPNGGHNGNTWLYDHAGQSWAAGDPVTCSSGTACSSPFTPVAGHQVDWTKSIANLDTFVGVCVSDIPTLLVWCEQAGNGTSYNSATDTWIFNGGTYQSTTINGNTGDLDTSKRIMWVFGNGCDNSGACGSPVPRIISISLPAVASPTSSVTTTNQTSAVQAASGSACDALYNVVASGESPGIQYDLAMGQFVNYPQANGNTLVLFNPTTLSCSNLSFSGGPPASTVISGINGRWRYFPSIDAFALLSDASSDGTTGSSTNVPAYLLSLNAPDPSATVCSISPASVGPWTIGQVISQTFTNSGCTASSWSSTGTWPTGITFNTSTGVASGTVGGSPGTFTPSVIYSTATVNLNITVNVAPSITTTSPLPGGTVTIAYTDTFTASGGTLPLSWSELSGTIPPGLVLSSTTGVLSGTPTQAGTYTFTAQVADANLVTSSGSFQITIAPQITITSPTANQVIAGFTGFNFTATLTNPPANAYCMAWQVDAYLPPGQTCVKAPYTLFHNTFMELNGTHTVKAILKDALGNTLATATQTFSIANTWPIAAGIGMTVATGTPLTSPWSGTVSITPTITGPDAAHSKDTTWFVDGVSIFKDPGDLAASPTFSIDTTQFTNGQHIVAVEVKDNFGGISYGSDNFYVGSALEWSQPVTFSNGAAAMELRTNMREVFLAPAGTFQLTATIYNTDGSTTSTTPVYNSENTAAVTVTSGGLLTGQTPVAFNPAMSRVDVMAPLVSGTDLVCQNHTNCNSGYLSASHLMTQQNVGQMITIPGGAGTWVAGTYYIQSVQSNGSGAFTMMSCTGTSSVCSNANPGANQSVATSFQTGPTETVFAMVTPTAPNPPIYHFDCTNGAILSTYTLGHSCYWISAFNGTAGFPYTLAGGIGGDQTYSTGFSSGYVQDLVNAGFTAIETSPGAQPSASTTESAYSGGGGTIPTLVSNYQAAVSGTSLKYVLIGDTWLKNSGPGSGWGTGGLSQTTRATYSPAWTTTPWTHVLNAWNGTAYTVEAGDEYSDFGNNPFEGPINFAGGLQIVASGGGGSGESCSVTGNFILSSLRHFVISGSSITNMNSATGAFYVASQANTPFTFTCANVADGTYNSTNNPSDALLLEPYVSSWFNATDGTATSVNDYLRYTMFTNIRSQFTSATSGRPNVTFPAIGAAGCANVYGFANPSNGLADYATHYYTGFNIGYLGGRNAVRGVVHGSNANGLNTYDLNVSGGIGIMNPARADFGCYSASAPLINQNSTVTNNYGLQGYTANGTGTATGPGQDGTNSGVTNVTSFSGNTLTLNTDHLLRQIYPGITRIQLSAMSTSGDTGNYYIIGWPDTTHLSLAKATTDFLIQFTTLSGTITSGATTFTVADASTWNSGPPWIANIGGELISCTTLASNVFSGCTRGFGTGLPAAGHTSGAAVGLGGGTITFSNGDTKNLSTITAKQLNSCTNPASGNPAVVCGDTFSYTGSADQTILRHRGMTFTISGTSNSNLNSRTFYYNAENPGPVAANTQNFYREIPNGSSTSGTATIIAAQDFVPGRQGGTQSFYDPDVAFAGQIAGFYERGAGARVYSIAFNQNGYSATSGILNGVTPQQPSLFGYLCIDAACVETGYSGIQAYSHPHWRSLYQAENFHAVALANLLHQRLASYWLTTSLNSPDMGGNFECTARGGAKGKSVGCMNTTNAPQSISFVTTPYLQSGQNFGQFIANSQAILFSTVASGTSPVTVTVPAGGEVVWAFPATFANEFSQPTISVQPSDVTNAASVAVEYGYDQFLLDIGASTVNCGTGPSCTLPVDRNIGPVYYRLIYMNSSNAVISIGDVQTL